MKTTILLDQEPQPGGAHVVRALLKIEGETPTADHRTPLNLSIVLDRSGSMAGEKLHAAREAAALLVQRLAPTDVVSVVAYDDVVDTITTPTTANGDQLSASIRRIEAGGSTNLSGGWLKGREYVAANRKDAAANRVLLLTDGRANVGVRDADQLAGLCATANEQGVRTTTIGFGADYDEVLLRRMAEAGGGNMHYIEHADQAAAVFGDEIEGLLSIAAQNLALSIAPADATSAVAVHHSYPRRETADGMQLDLGDLYAREPKLVLIECLVTGPLNEEVQIAKLVLEAAVMRDGGSIEMQEIIIPLTTSLQDGPVANPEVRRELLLLEAAAVRNQVLEDQQYGNYDAASEKLREMADRLRTAGVDDAQIEEEAADLAMLAEQMNVDTWSVAETKYMYQRAYDSTRAMRDKAATISRVKRSRK